MSDSNISIAMATYNGSRFLREQLDSLARQTMLPSELVVTDDQSTDATIDILKKFAQNAPFPVHIRQNETRLGYQKNFIQGASICKSEFIAFCDQDDVWHEKKVELCADALQSPHIFLVYHNAKVVNEDLIPIGNLNYMATKRRSRTLELGPMLSPLGFTIVFKRALLDLNILHSLSRSYDFDGALESHDQWIPFLANTFGEVAYLNDELAFYRRHDRNAGVGTRWRAASSGETKALASAELLGWKHFQQTFSCRAAILKKVAMSEFDQFSSELALEGARRYALFSDIYARRVELYESDALYPRLRIFFGLLMTGAYGYRDPWKKGWLSAAKDLLRGVVRIRAPLRLSSRA